MKKLEGSPEEMLGQVLANSWVDKSKNNAIDVIMDYAKFLGISVERPRFRPYQNSEMYVPSPEMVKQFVYRIRKIQLRTMVKIAVETGASAGEVWQLTWRDVNLQSKQITITGVKGHRTMQYPISDELCSLLMQIQHGADRIFTNLNKPDRIDDSIQDYRTRLANETGNSDFHKIHFHSFRHFAISWHYFKSKDIVSTQRFARHSNINNTLRYVHIVKSWIKSNEYDVVYAENKAELTKYLSEGYNLVTKTDWGFCITKPKGLGA
jgi:integrase